MKSESGGEKVGQGSGGIVLLRRNKTRPRIYSSATNAGGLRIYTAEHNLKVRLACSEGMSQRQAAKISIYRATA
jgi:hypothetical protein